MIKLTAFEGRDFDRLINWIPNEELLITIAGNQWSYPLTAPQLQRYLDNPNSHSFNIVETALDRIIGHAEILVASDGTCKIDKLLVDPSCRGKGFCVYIMRELLRYAFEQLPVQTVELNVFDWNSAGIHCYEKSGFLFNHGKIQQFPVKAKTWTALNMTITKEKFLSSVIPV
jgi:RimJ/RimL family protein N-acetyltransferase